MPSQCRDFLVFAFCKGILCTSSMMGETICQLITASLYMTIFSQKHYFLLRSLVPCYLVAKKKYLWMVHSLWHPKLYIDFVRFCPVFVLATCALSDLLYSDWFSWTVVYFCVVVSTWGKEPQGPKCTVFFPWFATAVVNQWRKPVRVIENHWPAHICSFCILSSIYWAAWIWKLILWLLLMMLFCGKEASYMSFPPSSVINDSQGNKLTRRGERFSKTFMFSVHDCY